MCLACSYTCLTCSSFSVCTNCDPLTNRYQNGTTCPPLTGFYDNGTSIAVGCGTVLPGCGACTTNSTCTSCANSSFYLSLSSCLPCINSIANCSTCSIDGSTCLTCNAGFTLSSDNLTCSYVPCTDPYCISCPVNTSVC